MSLPLRWPCTASGLSHTQPLGDPPGSSGSRHQQPSRLDQLLEECRCGSWPRREGPASYSLGASTSPGGRASQVSTEIDRLRHTKGNSPRPHPHRSFPGIPIRSSKSHGDGVAGHATLLSKEYCWSSYLPILVMQGRDCRKSVLVPQAGTEAQHLSPGSAHFWPATSLQEAACLPSSRRQRALARSFIPQ